MCIIWLLITVNDTFSEIPLIFKFWSDCKSCLFFTYAVRERMEILFFLDSACMKSLEKLSSFYECYFKMLKNILSDGQILEVSPLSQNM